MNLLGNAICYVIPLNSKIDEIIASWINNNNNNNDNKIIIIMAKNEKNKSNNKITIL